MKYTLLVPAGLIYQEVPAVNVSQAQFHAKLHNGSLEVTMNAHFPSILDAQQPVDAFLRAWEVDAHLRGYKIAFSFLDGEVIDRNPEHSGTVVLAAATCIMSSSFTVMGNITVSPREYPAPPSWATVSDLARRMYSRFETYQEKRESIFTSGYYCLTELQAAAGNSVQRKGRGPAAEHFRIDVNVLNTLGELTSERGGAQFARKAGAPEPTPAEAAWLAAAVPMIIRHVASVDAGVHVNVLTMVDLPALQ
ncbi:hypothetical protein [Pseudoduganella sp. UC29_71]|uniref:hypothetical protein n=1 Tax=Pseudoduganella sp. UC29_71 TaxID=3350174 RepID=UPI003672355B